MSLNWKTAISGSCCGCTGRTSPCDPAPTATIVCRTASASLTKCGFDEYGTPSNPPAIYTIRVLTGSIATQTYTDGSCTTCLGRVEDFFSGSSTYSIPDCTLTTGGYADQYQDSSDPCVADSFVASSGPATSFSGYIYGAYVNVSSSNTLTTYTLTGTNSCSSSQKTIGTYTETLSSEYTTLDLIGYTVAAVPSFSGSYSAGTCQSLYDITSDELTCTVRHVEFKFTLPSLTGYTCYKISFTYDYYDGSGTYVGVAAGPYTYLWNGTDTETPAYTMYYPRYYSKGLGTLRINATYSCACS